MIDDDMSSPMQSSAQELLRPLQETADRVSRQVEQFAQILDQHLSRKNATNNSSAEKDPHMQKQDLFNQTMVLMDKYSQITSQDSSRSTARNPGNKQSQKNRKSLGDSATQEQNMLLESRLWSLTGNLLACEQPSTIEKIDRNCGSVWRPCTAIRAITISGKLSASQIQLQVDAKKSWNGYKSGKERFLIHWRTTFWTLTKMRTEVKDCGLVVTFLHKHLSKDKRSRELTQVR